MSACQLWAGQVGNSGYGKRTVRCEDGVQRCLYAHRMAFHMATGVDPVGRVVMHSCDNKLCVNPEHLSLGSQADNMSDMVSKKRHRFGATHRLSKLTEEAAIDIFTAPRVRGCQTALARRYGVVKSTIQQVWLSETWTHVTAGLVPGTV